MVIPTAGGPGECVTCGDAAVEAVVVDATARSAVVETGDGAREQVGIELVAPVAAGDRLLCHAGIALARLSPDGARLR